MLLVASRLTERGVLYGLLRLAHDTSTLAPPSANAKYRGGTERAFAVRLRRLIICSSSVVARFHA